MQPAGAEAPLACAQSSLSWPRSIIAAARSDCTHHPKSSSPSNCVQQFYTTCDGYRYYHGRYALATAATKPLLRQMAQRHTCLAAGTADTTILTSPVCTRLLALQWTRYTCSISHMTEPVRVLWPSDRCTQNLWGPLRLRLAPHLSGAVIALLA